jgi:hypothetical protein
VKNIMAKESKPKAKKIPEASADDEFNVSDKDRKGIIDFVLVMEGAGVLYRIFLWCVHSPFCVPSVIIPATNTPLPVQQNARQDGLMIGRE